MKYYAGIVKKCESLKPLIWRLQLSGKNSNNVMPFVKTQHTHTCKCTERRVKDGHSIVDRV